MNAVAFLQQKFAGLWLILDDRACWLVAANEVVAGGYGGVFLVSAPVGCPQPGITRGITKVEGGFLPEGGWIRCARVGGRPSLPPILVCWLPRRMFD